MRDSQALDCNCSRAAVVLFNLIRGCSGGMRSELTSPDFGRETCTREWSSTPDKARYATLNEHCFRPYSCARLSICDRARQVDLGHLPDRDQRYVFHVLDWLVQVQSTRHAYGGA